MSQRSWGQDGSMGQRLDQEHRWAELSDINLVCNILNQYLDISLFLKCHTKLYIQVIDCRHLY